MTTTTAAPTGPAPEAPPTGRPPGHNRATAWMGRHKVWTALLAFAVLAVGCGAIFCNIY